MNLDRFVLGFAGFMVLLSLALGVWVHHYWFFFTAFVGLTLLQSSITGFCPAASVARKLGLGPGQAFR